MEMSYNSVWLGNSISEVVILWFDIQGQSNSIQTASRFEIQPEKKSPQFIMGKQQYAWNCFISFYEANVICNISRNSRKPCEVLWELSNSILCFEVDFCFSTECSSVSWFDRSFIEKLLQSFTQQYGLCWEPFRIGSKEACMNKENKHLKLSLLQSYPTLLLRSLFIYFSDSRAK